MGVWQAHPEKGGEHRPEGGLAVGSLRASATQAGLGRTWVSREEKSKGGQVVGHRVYGWFFSR